jgi:hypothetical protein
MLKRRKKEQQVKRKSKQVMNQMMIQETMIHQKTKEMIRQTTVVIAVEERAVEVSRLLLNGNLRILLTAFQIF